MAQALPIAPGRRAYLWAEWTLLYLGLPAAYTLLDLPIGPVPALIVVTLLVVVRMLTDPAFDRSQLWNAGTLRAELPRILRIWVMGAAAIAVYTAVFHWDMLFDWPRNYRLLWLGTLVGYPLLSVYPQELAYRTFFFYRYEALFPSRALLIAANAFVFGYMHLPFGNAYAIVFPMVGGVLMAHTYAKTRSTLTVSAEHSLYGCWMFTIGLGNFFFSGVLPQ